MWKPRRLTTLWAFTAYYSDSFFFTGYYFPEIKRPVREAGNSPLSSAEVKNGGAVYPLLHTSSWHGDSLTTEKKPYQSKGFNFDEFSSGGPYEKHAVAAWNLGTISEFVWRQRKTTKTCVQMAGQSQDFPDIY
jgi:hypothetical protein